MQTRPLRPADMKILMGGLTASQQETFDAWELYTRKWVETEYRRGRIPDFQAAMSEAYLALRRAAVNHSGQGAFRPFLDRCLGNAMRNMWLRERRRRQVSFEAHAALKGLDADELNTFAPDRIRCHDDPRVIFHRPRRRRKRYYRFSPVLIEVIRREAADAFQRGGKLGWRIAWRDALRAAGRSESEINLLIAEEQERLQKEAAFAANAERRAKRAAQQRARRLRQRAERQMNLNV